MTNCSPASPWSVIARVTASSAVTVESVDKDKHIVVVTGPSGDLQAIEAQRDEGKKFVAGLKPGDLVEIRYGQALALAVE